MAVKEDEGRAEADEIKCLPLIADTQKQKAKDLNKNLIVMQFKKPLTWAF